MSTSNTVQEPGKFQIGSNPLNERVVLKGGVPYNGIYFTLIFGTEGAARNG